jgi:hypothetical protein
MLVDVGGSRMIYLLLLGGVIIIITLPAILVGHIVRRLVNRKRPPI